jgi:hypothetical protein
MPAAMLNAVIADLVLGENAAEAGFIIVAHAALLRWVAFTWLGAALTFAALGFFRHLPFLPLTNP